MGCGASKGSEVASLEVQEQQRDPEDFSLEPLVLQMTNIEAFDAVFVRLGDLLNRLIELNNNVNHAIAECKAAYAPLANGYELKVSFEPAADVLLLDVSQSVKGAPTRPPPDVFERLLSDSAVREADADLEKARIVLHEHLASSQTYLPLKVTKDGTIAVGEAQNFPDQLIAVNTALTKLRGLLATRGSLNITAQVRATTAFKSNTVRAQLLKKKTEGGRTMASPVTLLEACSSLEGGNIKEAETFLVDRAQHLAHRGKGLDLQWELGPGKRVILKSHISNEDIQNQVEKLLQGINIALFRLLNAGASCRYQASLTNAVVEVVRPVISALQRRHQSSTMKDKIKELVSINPTVEFRKEDDGSPPSFDFNFNVELQEQAGIPPFPGCLPAEAATLLAAIDNLKMHIAGALQELPDISVDVDVLLEEAKEFYELCPDAAANKGFSMMEAVKCSKATGSNLRSLYNTQQLFLAFGENIKRVADELAESPMEVELMMEEMFKVSDSAEA